MNFMTHFAKPAAAAMIFAAGLSVQADAAIQCRGPDQLVSGNWISTPYCNDNYVAQIARSAYGMRVSNRAIRQNPNKKAEVCRTIGNDIRVNAYCQEHLPSGPLFRR